MTDSYQRKINYIRVSVTDRCNLRCRYCMPKEGIHLMRHEDMLSYEEILFILNRCINIGINNVRITGGEPLVRKGITDFAAHVARLDGIKQVNLTTNGILLKKFAKDLKQAGLNSINISLDTLNPEKYKYMTRGGDINMVLKGIYAAIECGIPEVKINCVAMKGVLNEVEDFVKLAKDLPVTVRFIELMPLGHAQYNSEFVCAEDIKKQIKGLIPIKDKSTGPASYYRTEEGKIGFIEAVSHAFCGECNRIRLSATGKLIPCLNSKNEIDVAKYAKKRDENGVDKTLALAINAKPQKHNFENKTNSDRNMNEVGG